MFKKQSIALLMLLPVLSVAQTKPYALKGRLTDSALKGTIILQKYINNQILKDTARIQNGFFEFKGFTDTPIAVNITFLRDADVSSEKSVSRDFRTVYIEAGVMEVVIADSLKNASIINSKINDDYGKFKKSTEVTDAQITKLRMQYYLQKKEQKDSSQLNQTSSEIERLTAIKRQTWVDYIKQYPDSYFSLQALKEASFPFLDPAFAGPLYDQLSSRVKQYKLAKELNKLIKSTEKVAKGKIAPNFTHPDAKGKMISLADFKGKYVLLDFWASWCMPCRAEAPFLRKAAETFRAKNFMVLGVSIDVSKDREKWIKALKDDQSPGIQLNNADKINVKGANSLYGITAIPANFLIGPDGKIIDTNLRGEDLEKRLLEIIK